MFKTNLASSEWMTILGGFIGSQLFVFLLTVSFAKNYIEWNSKFSYRICTISTYNCFFLFHALKIGNNRDTPKTVYTILGVKKNK